MVLTFGLRGRPGTGGGTGTAAGTGTGMDVIPAGADLGGRRVYSMLALEERARASCAVSSPAPSRKAWTFAGGLERVDAAEVNAERGIVR